MLEYFSSLHEFARDADRQAGGGVFPEWQSYMKDARKTASVLVGDAYREEDGGLTWYGAWDGTDPVRVVSYLGFYIGAAGAGGSLLRLYGAEEGVKAADFFEYIL